MNAHQAEQPSVRHADRGVQNAPQHRLFPFRLSGYRHVRYGTVIRDAVFGKKGQTTVFPIPHDKNFVRQMNSLSLQPHLQVTNGSLPAHFTQPHDFRPRLTNQLRHGFTGFHRFVFYLKIASPGVFRHKVVAGVHGQQTNGLPLVGDFHLLPNRLPLFPLAGRNRLRFIIQRRPLRQTVPHHRAQRNQGRDDGGSPAF